MECIKIKKSTFTKIGASICVVLFICCVAVLVGCGSTKVANISTFEETTLVKLAEMYGYDNFKAAGYIVHATVQKELNGMYSLYDKNSGTTFNQFYATEFREANPDLHERLEENREYAFYLEARRQNALAYLLNSSYNARLYELHVVRVDGLRTMAEIEAENQAKKEAEEQKRLAAQKADEEANRYDPKDFYFLESDFTFRPADYEEKDLFDAVSIAEKLLINYRDEIDWFGVYSRNYVSDVIFVRQDGQTIVFKTEDNAISQVMKISGRSGLKGGEKVRVYYRVAKEPILEWDVRAIKKL